MKRALVIEDNRSSQKLFGDHLRRMGFDVVICGTAAVGLAHAAAETFDIVIMDIQLPGMDGLTATERLRAQASTRGVPILAVSAHAMAGDQERILAAGCDHYLAKPIAHRDFIAAVERLVSRRPTGEGA